jgi:hypothetical protein
MKISSYILVLCLLFISYYSYSQCNESDANLKETTSWLKQIIDTRNVGRNLPPEQYKVSFDSCKLKVFTIGMNPLTYLMSDTIGLIQLNLRNIIADSSKVRIIGKGSDKIALTLNSSDFKYLSKTEISGNKILDAITESASQTMSLMQATELIINIKGEYDLDKRIIRALQHSKCLCGGGSENTSKSKF